MPGASTPLPAPELTAGELIAGRFKVLSLVGRGGNGSVYKVEQLLLKRVMALKTLHPVSISDLTFRRFQQEAQAASGLLHPNLVRAIDFGIIKGNQPFLVMDFVEGKPLSAYLHKNGSLGLDETLEIFIPIAQGLDYAHKLGVIHRDLKPGNIVLVKSESGSYIPKIVDFGIAKLDVGSADTDAQALTKTGEVFGTPLYMSPEQCASKQVDARSDIYSLGCVFFETLTGAPPFRGDTALTTMMHHMNAEAPTLREASLGKEFPQALESIVAKMLAKDPAQRYQNCEELCQHLLWLRDGEGEKVPRPPAQAARQSASTTATQSGSISWNKLILVSLSVFIVTSTAVGLIVYGCLRNSSTHAAPAAKPTAPLPSPAPDVDAHIDKMTLEPEKTPYFSQYNERTGVRSFVITPKVSLGEFDCWSVNHTLSKQEVAGSFKIARATSVIFDVGGGLPFEQYYASMFRTGDFDGLAIDCNKIGEFNEDNVDNIANTLLQFPSLQSILLKKTALHESTFSKIGELPDLRLLNLHRTGVLSKDVEHLSNLENLRVLSLDQMDRMTAILKRVSKKGVLRRLMLARCEMTPTDWSLIAQTKSIDTLDLMSRTTATTSTEAERKAITSCITQLPNLERLSVSLVDLIGTFNDKPLPPSCMRMLQSLHNLKQLEIAAVTIDQAEQLRAALPHCAVNKLKQRALIEQWFDSRAFDLRELK
ncbi:MAG TPA: serine/threonine-protein kinase [Planktothrix sp.]